VFLLLCITITPVAMPRIVQYTIDVVLPNKQWGALNVVFWMIVGLYLSRGILSFSLNYLIGWLGQHGVVTSEDERLGLTGYPRGVW